MRTQPAEHRCRWCCSSRFILATAKLPNTCKDKRYHHHLRPTSVKKLSNNLHTRTHTHKHAVTHIHTYIHTCIHEDTHRHRAHRHTHIQKSTERWPPPPRTATVQVVQGRPARASPSNVLYVDVGRVLLPPERKRAKVPLALLPVLLVLPPINLHSLHHNLTLLPVTVRGDS